MQKNNKQSAHACVIAYTFFEIDFRVSRYVDVLVEEGYLVDVFALRRKGQPREENVRGARIHHLQEREYNERGLLSFLVKMLSFWLNTFIAILAKQRKYRYDIVHVHNPPDFLVYAAIVPKMLGGKIIFDMHENLPEFYCTKFKEKSDALLVKILLMFERMAVRFSDYTIVAHDLLRERVMKRDGVHESKCIALLNYPSKANFIHSSNGSGETEFRIIYPGTISQLHGVDIAIRAMAIIKKNECKDVKFDIYGRSKNSSDFNGISKLIEDLDLKDTVRLHTVVPYEEICAIMAKASIGVVPKRGGIFGSEAFSTKVLEFMAAGLPVVMSRTKIDEYYFDDSTVMFFEPEDEHGLARCIMELYGSPDKRKLLVEKGKEFVENNNWEAKSSIYRTIVKELVEGRQ